MVSTDRDSWGDFCSNRDAANWSSRIIDACRMAGVTCVVDSDGPRYDENGIPRQEIDWFTQWGNGGQSWRRQKWAAWLAKQAATPVESHLTPSPADNPA